MQVMLPGVKLEKVKLGQLYQYTGWYNSWTSLTRVVYVNSKEVALTRLDDRFLQEFFVMYTNAYMVNWSLRLVSIDECKLL